MPFSTPPFIPQFGVGAPVLGHVPTDQLYFDTTASPYQGYVFNRSLGLWEQFGGGGGGGFPTTEHVNSTHAGITLGNKNVSYITTDGSGTVNNVTLPIPAPDAGALNAFWNTQWHVVVLKTRTNAADTVAVNPDTVTVTNSAFFDDVQEYYKAPEYLNTSFVLAAVGDMVAFKWNGTQWVFDPDSAAVLGASNHVNTNADIGLYGGGGNSYSHGGQGVFLSGGATTYGTPATGGYVQGVAGSATTGAGGFIRFKGGYSYTQGGNAYIYGGYTGGAAASHGGKIQLHGGYGFYGGLINLYGGNALVGTPGTIGGHVKLKSGIGYTGGDIDLYTPNAGATGSYAGNINLQGGQGGSIISISALGSAIGQSPPGQVAINTGGSTNNAVGNIFVSTGLHNTSAGGPFKGGNIVLQTAVENDGDDIGCIYILTGQNSGVGTSALGDIVLATDQINLNNGTVNATIQPGTGQIRLSGSTLLLEAGSRVTIGPDPAGNLVTRNLPVADPALAGALWVNAGGFIVISGASGNFSGGGVTVNTAAEAISSSVAFTNGAGAGAGTLTNAPAAGNPTKWIGINDNGTLRHFPCW